VGLPESQDLSQFEFLAVLLAIVLGLAITHLLRGVVQVISERRDVPISPTHASWTAFILVVIVLDWWVLYSWRDREAWTLEVYLVQMAWAITHYLIAVLLYPPQREAREAWIDFFGRHRHWFIGTVLALFVLDAVHTALEANPAESPWYPMYIGLNVLPLTMGLAVGRVRYHRFLSGYCLAVLIVWALVARRFLS
jgi:hypothetical protein